MNSHLITTFEDFEKLKEYVSIQSYEYVVLDTETDGVIERKAKLYGIGICFTNEEAFYIPIRNSRTEKWWTVEQEEAIKQFIYDLAIKYKLIGHNIIYDILVLQNNWGYDLTSSIFSDTILLKHTLDEERPHGLKETSVKYLGAWADKAQEALHTNIIKNGGKATKNHMEMWRADSEVLGVYCCWDVLLTRKLFDLFNPKLIAEGLHDLFYIDEIMPLYKEVTIPMKQHGFPIDVPYFSTLNENITKEIENLEKKILIEIRPLILNYEQELLNEMYPVKKTGLFPKHCAQVINFDLPKNKNGDITLSKKELLKINQENRTPAQMQYLDWILGDGELDKDLILETRLLWHNAPIFNLKSNDDLKYLFFNKLGYEPIGHTEKGEPQIDDEFLESIKSQQSWIQLLVDIKKLNKLKATYIEGILERQIDGVIYTSMLQFGTTSGRYSSKDPNLQNLPRVKEDDSGLSELVLIYVNSIKKGFIAGPGKKIINADYSQLEPRAFAEASNDKLLQQSFINGEDLYGSIAVNVWHLDCKPNEVKKKYPEYRQQAKIIALAVVYGAEAGRISKLMGIDYKEAQQVIDDYLNAYPGLRTYMSECNKEVCTKGEIRTKYGRIRHLPEAKRLFNAYGLKLLDKQWAKKQGLDETRWKFKNMLNLAKNHKIQGLAARIVNSASIAVNREFKRQNINALMIMNLHDEITVIADENQSEKVKTILKDCMENTIKLSVPLKADPIIANNWSEAK